MSTQTGEEGKQSADADAFDAAFNEAIQSVGSGEPGSGKPTAKTEPVTEPVKTEPVTEPVKTEPAKTEPVKTEPVTEPVKTEPAKTEPVKTEPVKTEPVVVDPKVLAEEAARRVAAEAAEKATREAAEKAAREAAEIKDPVLTEEQNKQIAEFEKEWPDVAKAVETRTQHAIAAVEARFARALTAIVGKIYEDVGPMAATATSVESQMFRDAVLKAHPDYDTHFPNLEGWIAKQPAYLTEAYKRVYNEGNVQEVSDLVTRYKEANGIETQALGTTAPSGKTTPAEPTQAQLAARARATELAPVTGKRTSPAPSGADPEDYDGAFAEAAAALSK